MIGDDQGGDGGFLGYATPAAARPGLVTALGVISIIVGSLGMLSSLVCGFQAGAVGYLSTSLAGGLAMGNSGTPSVTVDADEAKVIVAAINASFPMSQADQAILERVLPHVDVPFSEPADGVWTREHVDAGLGIATPTTVPGVTMAPQVAGPAGNTPLNVSTTNGSLALQTFSGTTGGTVLSNSGGMITFTVEPGGSIAVNDLGSFEVFPTTAPFKAAIIAAVSLQIVGIALAVFLLVVGIQTLRQRPSGLRGHRTWAWLKIVQATLLAAAFGYLVSGVTQAQAPDYYILPDGTVDASRGSGGLVFTVLSLVYAAVYAAVLLAYPVAVLITLRAPSVREAAEATVER